MKTLYAEDISKYTETKGCPSNVISKFLDSETGIFNNKKMSAYFKENPSEQAKYNREVWKYGGWQIAGWGDTPKKEEFFNDPDSEGCIIVPEKNISVDDKSMKVSFPTSSSTNNVWKRQSIVTTES